MPAIFMPSAAKWDARISFIFAVSYSSAADTATFLLYSIAFFLRNYESAYNHIVYDITSAGKMQVAIGNSAEIYKMLLF